MKCVTLDEGCAILQDVHVGICGSHVGARSLVGKTYMQGFYWPTVVSDADSLVLHCEGCQFFARQTLCRHTNCRPYQLSGLSQLGG
jgi:hypothetical protein